MSNVLLYFFPDIREMIINLKVEVSFEECFSKIEMFCEHYKGKLKTTHILAYDENQKLMFEIYGVKPRYKIEDGYEDLETQVLEVFNEFFLNDPSITNTEPPSLEELVNLDVVVEGYTQPSEFYYGPDFVEKCKFSEALGIIKEMTERYAEDYPKLTFDVETRDGKHLFWLYHDLDRICLGELNELHLTEELIREVIGLKR